MIISVEHRGEGINRGRLKRQSAEIARAGRKYDEID